MIVYVKDTKNVKLLANTDFWKIVCKTTHPAYVTNTIFVKRYTIVYWSFYINCFDQRGSRLEIKLTTYIYVLHDNESLVEPCTDYCVIGFLGRPRIHATKRDECQDDDGRVILQTTSDFGIVYLQLKGNERKPPNFF